MMTHRKRLLAGEFGEPRKHTPSFETPSYSNTLPSYDGMDERAKEFKADTCAVDVIVSDEKGTAGDYRGALSRLAFKRQ